MLGLERGEGGGRCPIGEAATGGKVREENLASGVEDLRRLGHEVNAAEDDDLRLGACGFLRQREAVADEISDVLDLALLVVVGEDDRVELLLQREDRRLELCGGGRERHAGVTPSLDRLTGPGRDFQGREEGRGRE
jgi:hypothetical protein